MGEQISGDPAARRRASGAAVVWEESVAHVAERLFPAEDAYLARAVDERRAEFATVRACARRALAGLGIERRDMTPGTRGAPPWPDGVVGSMTHTRGLYVAVAARTSAVRSIGIDAEENLPLPRDVLDVVAGASERQRQATLSRRSDGVAWDRLLFSAKESVYKAWYPLTRQWLGFEEVDVRLDPSGTFAVRHRDPAADEGAVLLLAGLRGWWWGTDSHVVTACVSGGGPGVSLPGPCGARSGHARRGP